ncbi:hypothetical protein [Petroclostridium sp. X23]|uniref:hypothetical protein n=1 Tax=Petroclostridium sp. X23 TaxID=3045146 RepID=UPI0024AE4822|nr:hypothetical protein [Petroclostridium sp. X23]WHH60128.1 hypothetical protein QKW49_05160 [Petroclostridium sp. X23]
MKHQRKRVSKIVDELITYLFSIGATDINVNIQERLDDYKISLRSNYTKDKNKKVYKLLKALQTPKQEEIEEYYWELAGDSDVGTELSLIGMMIDKVEVDLNTDFLEIILYRNR